MAGPTRLSVTLSPEGIRCTVVIAGTLDAVSTAAIDALYDQLVGAGFGEVVLELSGLDQIDEAGAVAIAQLWCHLREHGVCSHVCGLASKFMGSPIEISLPFGIPGPRRCASSVAKREEHFAVRPVARCQSRGLYK